MKALVIGGTGTVGSLVVGELVKRNVDVQVLTRDAAKAPSLPRGAVAITGDLLDPKTIRKVFQGIDGVFLLNALGPAETHEGLMAVNGARLGGVERIVYLSVHDVEKAPHLPHFGSKLPIQTAIAASGISYTIVKPNNFFQNDVWFKDALLQYGVYPQPIGDVGLSRVDVRDIAEVAALALTTDGHDGKSYNLVGPEALTGLGTAEIWSRVLGKQIAYGGNDMDRWEEQQLAYLPAFLAFDFRLMYEFFQKSGLKATSADIELQTKLLGHAPRRFEDYAREMAETWKG